MNIHPLVVHFPIAFLSLYAVLELIPFKKITKQSYWFYLKACLLLFGVIGAGIAVLAGQSIENQFGPRALISLHSKINETASFLFGLLLISYLVAWAKKDSKESFVKKWIGPLWQVGVFLYQILYLTPLRIMLVFVALLLLTIGGALGGIIVYGPNLDPFTSVLYSLLTSAHLLPLQ